MSQAIHSNFLIHWTGKDIEKKLNPKNKNWIKMSEDERKEYNQEYLKRLWGILNYGLWMTKPPKKSDDRKKESFKVNNGTINLPDVARVCFTELKLSQADEHAHQYGRLGIGVKRGFLFDRLGGPMFYLQHNKSHLFFPPYPNAIVEFPELISFFKPMSPSKSDNDFKKFTFYEESEWRIIFSENIKKLIEEHGGTEKEKQKILKQFVELKCWTDQEKNEFFQYCDCDNRPEFLVPLDGWFSMIIYPNPYVKIAAQEDNENYDIRGLIKMVKANKVRGRPPAYESKMMPMEIDLSSCRNF